MAGKGFRHGLFILIVALAFAGCTPPLGGIGERSVSVPQEPPPPPPPPPTEEVITSISATLNRSTTYTQGDFFRRDHLRVNPFINGVIDNQQTIPLNLLAIYISGPALAAVETLIGEEYQLPQPGTYTIRVKHTSLNFEASLTITVTATTPPGGGNQGPSVGWGWETED